MFGWIIKHIKIFITCKANQNLSNFETSIKWQSRNEQTIKRNFLLKRYFKNEKKWHISDWRRHERKIQKIAAIKSAIERLGWWIVGWKAEKVKYAFKTKTWKKK